MADKRLREIHRSTMSESTMNIEFLDWLKRNGMNVVLAVVVIVCLFVVYLRWGEWRETKAQSLWDKLQGTTSPAALEALADEAKGEGSIPELALLSAASGYFEDILRDQSLDYVPPVTTESSDKDKSKDPNASESTEKPEPPPMTPEERTKSLDKMDHLYTRVMEMTRGAEANGDPKEIIRAQALFGMAAVCEMRSQWDQASKWYDQIEKETRSTYPALADLAVKWQKDRQVRVHIDLPTEKQIEDALFAPKQIGNFGEKAGPPSPLDKDDQSSQTPATDGSGGKAAPGGAASPPSSASPPAGDKTKTDAAAGAADKNGK